MSSRHRGGARRQGAATRAYRGGEFGYRTNAHHTFKTFGLGGERGDDTRAGHFKHGVKAGKIKSENKIIPHLKVARRLSNVALLGGAGLTAYGVHRAKSRPVAKADSNRRRREYSGAALGVGGTVAAGSVGGARVLEHQGRRWSGRAARDLDAAHRIVPNMGGHLVNPHPDRVKNRRVPDIAPARSNTRVQNDKGILSGKSKAQAHAAGRLRGSAAQARYFAGTYGGVAHVARKVRNPALALAGAGGGGLLMSRRKVNKALLYERDKHTSLLHAAGATAGLGLAAWGVPRHKFLGPALAHGVKQATKHESQAALEALRLAETAANSLRDVTGRGERRLRTIQHLDQAINRVPRAIRPEVATAAGVLLVGHSRPVRRERYTPVLVGGGY